MPLQLKTILLLAITSVGISAYAQDASLAQSGTLNYVEGQVSLAGVPLSMQSIGKTTLQPSQLLETRTGRAEILLTPGVFLRVGANSAISIVSPEIMHTEVALVRGKADVEIDQIYKENVILVDDQSTQTQLIKTGLYAFNFQNQVLRVFNGKAEVSSVGASRDAKHVEVKGGHELLLNGESMKPAHFDKKVQKMASTPGAACDQSISVLQTKIWLPNMPELMALAQAGFGIKTSSAIHGFPVTE